MQDRILIVEDDPNFRNVLALALELQGFQVRQATGVQAALDILAHERPDLIISDLELGATDGRALCRQVRATPQLRDIPYVVLSAFIDPDETGSLPDLPADRFLSKQISMTVLTAHVTGLLVGREHDPEQT